MSIETLSDPLARPALFPIDDALMQERVSYADDLTAAELHAWHSGNLETLAPDDPFLYLLQGRARPDLGEHRAEDYATGVCVVQAVVRRQLRLFEQEGSSIPAPAFDPENDGPAYRMPVVGRHLPPVVRGVAQRTADLKYIYGRVAGFTGTGKQYLTLRRGVLANRWAAHGMPFVTGRQFEANDIDAMMLGVGDAFSLYYQLYGGMQGNAKVRLRSRRNYFTREDRRHSWLAMGVPSQDLCYDKAGVMSHYHRRPHYRAVSTSQENGDPEKVWLH